MANRYPKTLANAYHAVDAGLTHAIGVLGGTDELSRSQKETLLQTLESHKERGLELFSRAHAEFDAEWKASQEKDCDDG